MRKSWSRTSEMWEIACFQWSGKKGSVWLSSTVLWATWVRQLLESLLLVWSWHSLDICGIEEEIFSSWPCALCSGTVRREPEQTIWYQICHLSGLVSWSPLDKTFLSPIWETWKCDRILSGWEWGKVDYAFPLHSRKSTSKALYPRNVVGTPHTVGESIHSPSVVNKHGNVAERQINSGPDIPPQ